MLAVFGGDTIITFNVQKSVSDLFYCILVLLVSFIAYGFQEGHHLCIIIRAVELVHKFQVPASSISYFCSGSGSNISFWLWLQNNLVEKTKINIVLFV